MINVFAAFIFTSLSFMISTSSIQLGAVKRAFIHMPLSYFEISVVENNGVYYLGKAILEEKVGNYLDYTISKYVSNFEVDYQYITSRTGGYCTNGWCDGVRVTLSAKMMFNHEYNQTMFYQIGVNNG